MTGPGAPSTPGTMAQGSARRLRALSFWRHRLSRWVPVEWERLPTKRERRGRRGGGSGCAPAGPSLRCYRKHETADIRAPLHRLLPVVTCAPRSPWGMRMLPQGR